MALVPPITNRTPSTAGLSMDLIAPLHALLDRLLKGSSFVLDEFDPLDTESGRTYGALDYHGGLNDGRNVLLGFSQLSACQTITAEIWVLDNFGRVSAEAGSSSKATRRQVWSYRPTTDGETLARTIVIEVLLWLSDSELLPPPL